MVSATQPLTPSSLPPSEPGPAWEVARLFPNQGHWSREDYLQLSELTNRRVELVDGHVEIPEMPGLKHQRIVQKLLAAIQRAVPSPAVGEVIVGSYPVRIAENSFREPDLLFVRAENLQRMHERFSEVADLVVEVVSTDRKRDLVEKRADYAAARIPEYWIVDPTEGRITVLRLAGESYTEHGVWTAGGTASSTILPTLRVSVDEIM